jgi:pyrroline-5-carboxylate reductase
LEAINRNLISTPEFDFKTCAKFIVKSRDLEIMLSKKIGILGVGNMGSAFIRGFLVKDLVEASYVFVYDIDESKIAPIQEQFGVQVASDEIDLLSKVDILILAVKPQVLPEVMEKIAQEVTSDHTIISIAAGIPIATIKKFLTNYAAVVRVMPNTPAMIGEAISAYSSEESLSAEIKEEIECLLGACGQMIEVPEKLMDAVTGLSGSGPAYMFLILDALADGGVKMGIPRAQSVKLAAQTMLGAAMMLVKQNKHPAELKDMVTSPGGTTAAGLHELEKGGVRAALINAVEAATLRSKELGKPN